MGEEETELVELGQVYGRALYVRLPKSLYPEQRVYELDRLHSVLRNTFGYPVEKDENRSTFGQVRAIVQEELKVQRQSIVEDVKKSLGRDYRLAGPRNSMTF